MECGYRQGFGFMSGFNGLLICIFSTNQWHTYVNVSNIYIYKDGVKVKVKVMLQLTVSQSVGLGVEPQLGLMTRYFFRMKVTVLSMWGRPLWWEVGSVICQSVCINESIVCIYIHLQIKAYFLHLCTIYTRPPSVQAQYSRYALFLVLFVTTAV
jgi:hypothetical protein